MRKAGVGISLGAAVLLLAVRLPAQASRGPLPSAQSLSEYMIQGAVNDQMVELLVVDSSGWDEHTPKLQEALRESDAAWKTLTEELKHWKPTARDQQQHLPEHFIQLVLVARGALLDSMAAAKNSTRYGWLRSQIVSSLDKVDQVQSRLKLLVAQPAPSRPAAKTPKHSKK